MEVDKLVDCPVKGDDHMHVSIQIEPESGIAIVTCSGELRVRDAKEDVVALWNDNDWAGKAAVWDFREAQFVISSSEVQALADFVLTNQPAPPEKVAFVTGRDVDFGLARMFEAFRSDPRTAFKVFREFDAALRWAGAQEPNAA
jgi:hypothetical protein